MPQKIPRRSTLPPWIDLSFAKGRIGRLAVLAWVQALPLAAQTPHCGTGLWIQKRQELGKALERRSLAAQGEAQPVRTLETPHFAIRYVLRGLNQARLDAGDRTLEAAVDSLYEAAPGDLSAGEADAWVHGRLDAIGAAHPRFITTMAGYFEAAYRYYVDTLGMRRPSEPWPQSVYYGAPAPAGGRYPVDVADIGTADPTFLGQEIYALTYPPGYGGMLIENDFLYNVSLDADGNPTGSPISSRYQGRVIHDYSEEWDLGLKVTCYHELYHSVQFAYTPDEERFHMWYETSATGMEERKAPEVDDYLQYLPEYMEDLARVGMFAFPARGLSQYGNSIYHLFLTRELGEDFDVRLWSTLAANGNDIKAALEATYAHYGRTAQDVYARYAAQLAFAGRSAANPLPPFSSDLPAWPRVPAVEIDLGDTASQSLVRSHPPGSIRALTLLGSGTSGKILVQPDTLLRVALSRLRADTSSSAVFSGRIVSLDAPGEGGEVTALLSNGSPSQASDPAAVRPRHSRLDARVYPYPNPMERAVWGRLLVFSRLDRAAAVTVYSETGVPLRALSFPAGKSLWAWDLLDADGGKVRPGLYYYRVDGGEMRPLYLK